MADHQEVPSDQQPAAEPPPSSPSKDGLSGTGPAQPDPIPSPPPGASPTPGGNNLNAIDDSDVDKVVPKRTEETELRDTSSPPGSGGRAEDDTGAAPQPL
ncbi:hypothetical protein LMG27177_05392 [Paraburkholderia fynbosensis]|uniref:Uncharacterized protein n=1 Tax=Paraburkholderia fynbosensis TaxID=1200993 RepID=A0A6J5GNU7_9BURK|nr:hypothetical protein LMG27177_05392 [Paraburkholderia fynbosensis]